MTSQIPKISGNYQKINVVRNFKISAFSDIIYPFVPRRLNDSAPAEVVFDILGFP